MSKNYRAYVYLPSTKLNLGDFEHNGEAMRAADKLATTIREMTVDESGCAAPIVEDVRPKWIKKTTKNNLDIIYWECSNCKKLSFLSPTKFCCYCGAKMSNFKES